MCGSLGGGGGGGVGTVLAGAGDDDVFHRLPWQALLNAIKVYFVCNNGIFIKNMVRKPFV